MSITRREALAVAAGCGLTTAATGADGQPPAANPRPQPDPVLTNVPPAIRPVFESTFPNHRCVRMAVRQVKGAAVCRGTFFNPADTTVRTKSEGEDLVTQPILYDLEVSADGKIIEETAHPVLDRDRLPKAVIAAYEKWNPKGVKGMAVMWATGVPRGKDRVYSAYIIVNAIKGYSASFKEDGTVVAADPAIVP